MNRTRSILRVIANALIPVLLALFCTALILLFLGENPIEVYRVLFVKSLLSRRGLVDCLHYAAPLMLSGLAIALCFKAQIYNMGIEGQILAAGFCSGLVGAYLPAEFGPFWSKILAIFAAILAALICALIPALLKAYWQVNEMVLTLMLNYVVIKVLEYLTSGRFRDASSGYVCTPTIRAQSMFQRLGQSKLTAFFFLALTVLFLIYILMRYGSLGYSLKSFGLNPQFTEAMGLPGRLLVLKLMGLSAVLAGLAGAGQMMAEQFKYHLAFSGSPGLGWDGMLIALLGSHHPLGIFAASIFYASLKVGADKINLFTSVPKEIISMLQGLMILFLSVRFFQQRRDHSRRLKGQSQLRQQFGAAKIEG